MIGVLNWHDKYPCLERVLHCFRLEIHLSNSHPTCFAVPFQIDAFGWRTILVKFEMGAVFALVHILAIYLNFYSLSICYIHVCPECKKSAQQFDRTKNEAIFLAPIRWDDRGDGGEGGWRNGRLWPLLLLVAWIVIVQKGREEVVCAKSGGGGEGGSGPIFLGKEQSLPWDQGEKVPPSPLGCCPLLLNPPLPNFWQCPATMAEEKDCSCSNLPRVPPPPPFIVDMLFVHKCFFLENRMRRRLEIGKGAIGPLWRGLLKGAVSLLLLSAREVKPCCGLRQRGKEARSNKGTPGGGGVRPRLQWVNTAVNAKKRGGTPFMP